MSLNSFLSNQGTQTSLLTDNTGGTAGTLIPVMKIDTSATGTAGVSMFNGTMGISGGTTPLTADVSAAGTLTGVGSNVAINAAGLTSLGVQVINTFTGTLVGEASLDGNTWNPTTFVTLANGSIITSITGPTFAQVNLAGLGSYRVRASGLSAGSAVVFLRGNQGAANIMLDNSLPVGANTIGNIGTLLAGTISAATVNAGTFKNDGRPARNLLSFGTQYGTSGAGASTIIGSTSVGAGTYLWVNDITVNNPNANVGVIVGFGTAQQGTNVLLRGTFGTAGAVGLQKAFPLPVNAGMTNQDLVLSLTGAGTVDVSISYFISA